MNTKSREQGTASGRIGKLRLKRYVLKLFFSQKDFWEFVAKVRDEGIYDPIFVSTAEHYLAKFGLKIDFVGLYTDTVSEIGVKPNGQLFIHPRGAISSTELFRDTRFPDTFVKVYFSPRSEKDDGKYARTIVNAFSPNQEIALKSAQDMVGRLCDFKQVVREDVLAFEDFSESERITVERLSKLARGKVIDPEIEKSSMVLNDAMIRSLLLALKIRGPTLRSDLGTLTGARPDMNRVINQLVNSNIVNVTYAIVCDSTNYMLLSASSEEETKAILKTGAMCPKCNKPLKEERLEEVYGISRLGEELMQGSKWMSIILRRYLIEAGCKPENIFLDVKIDEDQLDVVAIFWGKLLVFELKDRNFELGDIYKFNSKCFKFDSTLFKKESIWNRVVVSTGKIADLAKNWIPERQRNIWKLFEDSCECLEHEIKEMLDQILTSRSFYILKGKASPTQNHFWGIWSQILSRKFIDIEKYIGREVIKEEIIGEQLVEEE